MGTRLSKNPISAALSVTVRYTTVTSVTPSLALGLWRFSWAPPGPGPVFLFFVSPRPPARLGPPGPPTHRELNLAPPCEGIAISCGCTSTMCFSRKVRCSLPSPPLPSLGLCWDAAVGESAAVLEQVRSRRPRCLPGRSSYLQAHLIKLFRLRILTHPGLPLHASLTTLPRPALAAPT